MNKVRIMIAGMAVVLFCLTAADPAGAVDFGDKLALHGYGNWAYGKTDGNTYVNGNDEGAWDTMGFSLGVTAAPAERFAVHAQTYWEVSEAGIEPDVDFAFAEYTFFPALGLRAGRIKQPFGIYTEIFDVGVLFPFNNLPQGIYGPSGLVAESYMGVGATGALDIAGSLRLRYDLYGGEIESAFFTPWAEAEADALADEQVLDLEDVVGGRLQVGATDGSYTVGVSAYTGTADHEASGEVAEHDRHSTIGAHAELMINAFTLRTEYVYKSVDDYTTNAAYAEVSYLLTPHWLVAVRYDWTKVDFDGVAEVDAALLESTDIGVALNYIVNPFFVVKLAYHMVDGNRFTTANEESAPDKKTSLITAGVSFSF